jgi:protein-tyrosine phosphatase
LHTVFLKLLKLYPSPDNLATCLGNVWLLRNPKHVPFMMDLYRSFMLIPTASNFRDLGAGLSAKGAPLRAGQLYRSSHLADLDAQGLSTLRALGVTHSIDLRGEDERAAKPYAIEGLHNVPMTVEPVVVRRIKALAASGQVPSALEAQEIMRETYRNFVHQHTPTYARFLRQVLDQPTPQVFHCTAGKDRTGYGAALILSALEVDRSDIEHDYMLTNRLYRREAGLEGSMPEEVLDVLWKVQPDFLHAAFDAIDHAHGSMDAFLQGPLGLSHADRTRLQAKLIEG